MDPMFASQVTTRLCDTEIYKLFLIQPRVVIDAFGGGGISLL